MLGGRNFLLGREGGLGGHGGEEGKEGSYSTALPCDRADRRLVEHQHLLCAVAYHMMIAGMAGHAGWGGEGERFGIELLPGIHLCIRHALCVCQVSPPLALYVVAFPLLALRPPISQAAVPAIANCQGPPPLALHPVTFLLLALLPRRLSGGACRHPCGLLQSRLRPLQRLLRAQL